MARRDPAVDRIDLMTLEAARAHLPRLDESKHIATSVSAMVIGSCIQAYTKIKYSSDNAEHARLVGLGLGWWDAMVGRGIPEWITTLGAMNCLLDLDFEAQLEFVDKMRGLVQDNGNEMHEIVPIARALYLYLGWDYDMEDIMKALNEHDNPIIDSWNQSDELRDLSLM